MNLTLVTAPAAEPITTEEAKTHLRVDSSDDDTYIDTLVKSARMWIERAHGIMCVNTTYDGSLDAFPHVDGKIVVPRHPLSSVTSITYYDDDLSTSTVFSSTKYQVDTFKRPPCIVIKDGEDWPTDSLRLSSGVVVRFVAGWGAAASAVPEDIKHAVKLLVGSMYQNREPEVVGASVSRVAFAVDSLLAPHRLW